MRFWCAVLRSLAEQKQLLHLLALAVRAIAQKVPHEHRHQGDRQQDKRREQRDVQHHDTGHSYPLANVSELVEHALELCPVLARAGDHEDRVVAGERAYDMRQLGVVDRGGNT